MTRLRAPRRPFSSLDPSLWVLCALVLGLTVLYPSLHLLGSALADWEMDALTGPIGRAAIRNTFLISLASVVTSGIVGTALAFLLTRYRIPGGRVLGAVAYLPFTLPPLVGVVAFYYIVGPDGFVPRALERAFGLRNTALSGGLGILAVHTYSFYVFFYAMVSAALQSRDRSLVEAARTLGAGPFLTFRRVTLPLLRPALAGAALLTFMSSGASFSAPLIFGGDRFPMLSTRVYTEMQQFHVARAETLTVALAALSFLGILLFRSRSRPTGAASKGTPAVLRSRGGRWAAGVLAWLCVLILVTPHLTILGLSFADHRTWYEEIFPTAFTLENYRRIFGDPNALAPILNSVWMSAVAAAATLVLALPAAYLIGRRRPGGRAVNFLVMLPWALPGTVIAMNIIAAFNKPWLPVYNTVWALPLAYFVRSVPLLTRMTAAAVEPFDASLVEAGRTLGATRGYVLLHVIVPLLAPAVVAGTALTFALSLGEFVASILLYIPDNVPISVQINLEWRGSGVGSAFAYSVFLMLLVTATFLTARRFASRVI